MISLPKLSVLLFFFTACFSLIAGEPLNINGNAPIGLRSSAAPENELLKKAERYREFNANPRLRSIQPYNEGDTLLLDFFDDKKYKATVKKVATDVNGVQGITAQVAGTAHAYCYLALSSDGTYMLADIPENNEKYFITKADDAFYLSQYNLSEFHKDDLPCGGVLELSEDSATVHSPDMAPALRSASEDTGCTFDLNAEVTINIMVVYTPAALAWMGTNHGSTNAWINIFMNQSNSVFANSETGVTLNVVHTHPTNYTETNSSQDLGNFQGRNDGYMDEVHTIRREYNADLLLLLADISYVGGQAFQLGRETGNPNYGFCIVRVTQAASLYTAAHEIGHNLGCGHCKTQSSSPGPGLFDHSAGWRGQISGVNKCTVMSYDEKVYSYLPYFSSPGIMVDGVPIGDATDADNVLTIKRTKHVVSRYSKYIAFNTNDGGAYPYPNPVPDVYDMFKANEPVPLVAGDRLVLSREPGTEPARYPVTVQVLRGEEDVTCEYLILSNLSFGISKRSITLSMPKTETLTFTGDSLSVTPVTITGTYGDPDLEVVYLYNAAGAPLIDATHRAFDAGQYYVYIRTEGDKYHGAAFTDCILTVNKAQPVITAPDKRLKYTGGPLPIPSPVTLPADAELEITYTGTGDTVYPENTAAPSALGSYSVKITYAGSKNYEAATVYAALSITEDGEEPPIGDLGGVTIGSGQPPARGAMLQLKESESAGVNSKQGLLLPRVSLTDLNSLNDFGIGLNAEEHIGLIVFNMNEDAGAGIYKGVYLWNGTNWERLNN